MRTDMTVGEVLDMVAEVAGAPTCTVYELTRLFAGCDLTDGHPTEALAARIIRDAQPESYAELRRIVYGDWPPHDVPAAGSEALQHAWTHRPR